jgi:hypothetical protein
MAKKKLAAEDIQARCELVIEAARGRNSMYKRMDELYDRAHTEGAPADSASAVLLRMPYGTNAIDLVTDMVAQAEMQIEIPAAKETAQAKKEADAQEKWLRAWYSLNEQAQHHNLIADAAWYAAQRSVVVARTLYSSELVEKGEKDDWALTGLPCVLQMRDPATTFWAESATGIEYVVESYPRLAVEIKRQYPGTLDDDTFADDTPVQWTEYWDATYRAYFCEDALVTGKGNGIVAHGFGLVPYAFGVARSTPRHGQEQRFRPLLLGVEDVLRGLDIYASIRATAAHDSIVNAWAVFSDTYGHGSKELQLGPDSTNYFGPQDKIQPIVRGALPADLSEYGAQLMAAFQQGTFPLALYGQVPGQLAGYAINMLVASGRRPMIPIYGAVQRALEGAFRNAVLICRNKVAPIVGDEIGLLTKERDKSGRAYRSRLILNTRNVVDDFDCTVTLTDPLPADEASNLRMAMEAVKSGLLSKETALTKYKIMPNALEELERIQVERIYEQLAPLHARQLAVERGYLPPEAVAPAPEPGQGANLPVIPQGLQQPEPPPSEQRLPQEMIPNPAVMQGMAGQGPQMPELPEMAGEAPAGEAQY